MNREPFFIIRWWRGLTLQMRLFLAFTLLFVFSIATLSLFLYNIVQMTRINRETQAIFEQNQQIYGFKTSVAQYQLALRSYENCVSEDACGMAEEALKTNGKQVADNYTSLQPLLEIDDAQNEQFTNSKSALDGIVEQVQQAVTAAMAITDEAAANQAWDKVWTLDTDAEAPFGQLTTLADDFQMQGQQDMDAAITEAAHFSDSSKTALQVVLPIFLLLAVLTALLIYREINQPLQQLAEAAQAVQSDSFQVQTLDKLAERGSEIGTITRRFIHMAESIDQRSVVLRQEADAIRAKIR